MSQMPTCKKCFKEIRFAFSIKDEIWNKLSLEWKEKTLCIECFLEELEKTSPNQEINLNDFYYIGINGEIDNQIFGGMFLSSNSRKDIRIYI